MTTYQRKPEPIEWAKVIIALAILVTMLYFIKWL